MKRHHQLRPLVLVVSRSEEYGGQVNAIRALAFGFGVDLVMSSDEGFAPALPMVAVGMSADETRCITQRLGETLSFIQSRTPSVQRHRVRYGMDNLVPDVLRGREIEEQRFASTAFLKTASSEIIHARSAFGSLWISGVNESVKYQIVGSGLPDLALGKPACEVVRPENLAAFVPLVAFFNRSRALAGWRPATLRASFMFDDPNLHSARYGYLCFRDLVQEASKFKYHVSLATVPADGWYAHRSTVDLFRRNARTVSFLIHGNTHEKEELAGSGGREACLSTLAQCLSRVESLERRTGLQLSRVMAPPHGACSEESIECMRRMGFEALCVSTGSLVLYNESAPWKGRIGVQPADLIDAFPVIPRFRVSKRCRNQILLAALLGQPIIMVGHHGDVAGGLDLLAELAEFINGLGNVTWMSMTEISRSNYRVAKLGNITTIEAFSNRVTVEFGNEEERIEMIRASGSQPRSMSLNGVKHSAREFEHLGGNRRYDIAFLNEDELDPGMIPAPRPRVWPHVRRALVEFRDRVGPLARVILPERR